MPPLCAKALRPTNGLALVRLGVRQLPDEVRQLAQVAQLRRADDLVAHLQLQVGDDRAQVGVAAAFADAVDGALHLRRAVLHGDQTVGDAELRIVVAVDADRHLDGLAHGIDRGGDLVRQPAAVGLAETHDVGAGVRRDTATLDRELRVVAEAVEEVLGVEDDRVDVPLQEDDAVVDHLEVLRLRDAQILAHVQLPGLAEDGHDRRLRLQELADVGVVAGARADAACRAEGSDARVLQAQALGFLEERFVARIRSGPTAFDVGDTEVVEAFGDAQLVLDGEGDVLRLAAVAQRRVVDVDVPCGGHVVASRAPSLTPSSISAWCSTRTASSAYLASITTDILISEVEII